MKNRKNAEKTQPEESEPGKKAKNAKNTQSEESKPDEKMHKYPQGNQYKIRK